MEKRGPMDTFIKRRNMNAEHQTNSDSSSQLEDGNLNETEASLAKRIRSSLTWKYHSSYNQFGFVSVDDVVSQSLSVLVAAMFYRMFLIYCNIQWIRI